MDTPPLAFDRSHPAQIAPMEGLRGGLGGTLRTVPEDFRVEELPLSRPSGHGNITKAHVQKRGTPTFDLLLFLSKSAKLSERRIGYAGLKDSRAVTSQYVTLPKIPPARVRGLRGRHFRVLAAHRDGRRLRIGHLLGNRFTIRIRHVNRERIDDARTVLETMVKRGLPNAYGEQRFGVRQDGHRLGEALIRGDAQAFVDGFLGRPSIYERNPLILDAREYYDQGEIDRAWKTFPKRHRAEKRALSTLRRGGTPEDVVSELGTGQRKIWLSAWQSYFFNAVLDERVRQGTFDNLVPGDIAWLHESSATFVATSSDVSLAQSGAASPTGPLPGAALRHPSERAGDVERRILTREAFQPMGDTPSTMVPRGLRRPLRVPIREASLEDLGDGSVVVRFVLPPGSFATVLLGALMQ